MRPSGITFLLVALMFVATLAACAGPAGRHAATASASDDRFYDMRSRNFVRPPPFGPTSSYYAQH